MKTVVSIDLDGVLCNFSRAFVKKIQQVYPEKELSDTFEPTDWGYTDVLAPGEFAAPWQKVIETENFWTRVKPYSENCAAMRLFLANVNNCVVYYTTARAETEGDSALEQTTEWLVSNGLINKSTSVIVTPSSSRKPDMLAAIGAQYSIDDKLDTVELTRIMLPESRHFPYLLDRPWNKKDRRSGILVAPYFTDFLNVLLKERK